MLRCVVLCCWVFLSYILCVVLSCFSCLAPLISSLCTKGQPVESREKSKRSAIGACARGTHNAAKCHHCCPTSQPCSTAAISTGIQPFRASPFLAVQIVSSERFRPHGKSRVATATVMFSTRIFETKRPTFTTKKTTTRTPFNSTLQDCHQETIP